MRIRYLLDDDYRIDERDRVRKRYLPAKHKEGFSSPDVFVEWWMSTLDKQNGCCVYCETPIRLIEAIVEANLLLRARSTRGDGVRGRRLELERRDPDAGYLPTNCALACYFCNNDKSYTYSAKDYKEFFGPARKRHFEFLADRL